MFAFSRFVIITLLITGGLVSSDAPCFGKNKKQNKSKKQDKSQQDDSGDRIAKLNASIEELEAIKEDRKLTREEGLELGKYRAGLKAAMKISRLLKSENLVRVSGGARVANEGDSFVIAKIETAPNSLKNVVFGTVSGVQAGTNHLFDFLAATPQNMSRDYEIVSRHENSIIAERALAQAKMNFNAQRARERQLLMAQQQAQRNARANPNGANNRRPNGANRRPKSNNRKPKSNNKRPRAR